MSHLIEKFFEFIRTDVWRIRSNELPRPKSFAIRYLRIILLAARGFNEDKIYLRASALTFYSLLSIVPVVAMIFGIAKGFGFEKLFEKQLFDKFPGQEEVLTKVVDFSQSLLATTKGGMIAGIGLAALFWTIIRVLGNIESSFNDIWGIKESRPMGRKFADYLSIMMICPLLFILSSSATVFITTQVTLITEHVALLGYFRSLIFFMLKLLPYCMVWGLFTFLYIFIPNTKVNFSSGLLAGVTAGTIYLVSQWSYITFQVGMAKYNAIYGSFAALPLFLIWLQISWLIVLFGAEVSFAHQNVDTYELEPDCLQASPYFKALLSLEIAHLVIKNFLSVNRPLTASTISHALEIPIRLVRELIHNLVNGGVLSAIKTDMERQTAYQPAIDINLLDIQFVLNSLVHSGLEDLPVAETKSLKVLFDALKGLKQTIENSSNNLLLKDI